MKTQLQVHIVVHTVRLRLSQAIKPSLPTASPYVYNPTVHIKTQIAYSCFGLHGR